METGKRAPGKGKQLTSTRTFASNPDPRLRPIFMITSSPQAHRAAAVAVVAAGCVAPLRLRIGRNSEHHPLYNILGRRRNHERATYEGRRGGGLDYARKSLLSLRLGPLPIDRASEVVVEVEAPQRDRAPYEIVEGGEEHHAAVVQGLGESVRRRHNVGVYGS
ncbi:hypothetical protein C8R45DRAFT_1183360 [Mycena sanguinolenta]|nr:hypothetical protein C8R45DRAFT_1183360 [Mycena sanguinolenta]